MLAQPPSRLANIDVETVVGWATVLPKGLHVLPTADRAFWVKADDLGLGPKPDAGAAR
jgi:hypothetical protein